MNIYALSSLIASIFCLSSGLFVFVKRYADRKCRYFGIASVLTGFWTLFPFAVSKAMNETFALFLARIVYIPAILTVPAWLHFVFALIKERWKTDKRILFLSYCFSLPFLFFIFSPLFIRGVSRFAPHFSVIPGPLYILFVIIFTLFFTFIIKTVFHYFKAVTGYYRNQLKFILLSFIFGFLSGAFHFAAAYFNKEPFPHDFLLIGYVGLIAYAILKYRLMDITVAITRTGIFIAVYTLVLGLPVILVTFGKSWLIHLLGENWWVVPVALLGVLATVGPFLYIYLEKRAEIRLLRQQFRYREILREAAREMTRIRNLKKLLNLIVHMVTKTVGISYSGIYLFDPNSEEFILKAGRNLKKEQISSIDKDNPLIIWLESNKEPVVREELRRRIVEGADSNLVRLEEQMRLLDAALIVPGFLKDKLTGFLILGEKRSGKSYSSEDIDTFSLLANQAALAIENASLYEDMEEQVKQRTKDLVEVQKQLVQAEKLATVGTLAGGVAHEINNPLTAILTNVQLLLASDAIRDPSDIESLKLIEEATRRCRNIVQKLMAYARKPLKPSEVSKINLLDVVKNVVSFLNYQLLQENIKIITEAEEDTYPVYGNHNELEQVVTNMVLNAKDSIKKIKKRGSIYISLLKNGKWVKMEIKDEGAGIPEDVISKIFDPFFTTKDVGKGLGLGLSICQAIVERHNGLIKVESEPDKGAVFTVSLPAVKIESEEKKRAGSKLSTRRVDKNGCKHL